MSENDDRLFFRLHSLGLINPLVRYSASIRRQILESVHFNTDMITSQMAYIDLVTDSLKESVSGRRLSRRRGALETGAIQLADTFKEYFGYKQVVPVSQGRLAEHILAKELVKPETIVPNNALFVTTGAHQETRGAELLEIPIEEAYDSTSDHPFKGNVDIDALTNAIEKYGPSSIPYVFLETSVNATGGHPVSMENLEAVHRVAKSHGIPVFIDTCRLLENALMIRKRESGYSGRSLREIVLEFCSHTDGCSMSATKDYLADTGGFIATNDEALATRLQDSVMLVGDGLSVKAKGRLNEALKRSFSNQRLIEDRVSKAGHLWNKLKEGGLPVVHPKCGYAAFVDTSSLCLEMGEDVFPNRAFLARLYMESGILPSENMLTHCQKQKGNRMIRLALPLSRYCHSQMDYVAKHIVRIWNSPRQTQGLKKIHQPPGEAGRFFAKYEPHSS